MIIRIQSNVGQWRVESVAPSSTAADLLSEIARSRGVSSYTRPLSFDPAGTRPLPIHGSNTLEEMGLKHGSMIFCRVAEAGKCEREGRTSMQPDSKRSASSHNDEIASKKKTNVHSIDLTAADDNDASCPHRLKFGTFRGVKIFRNGLHPGETLDEDFVTLASLIPSDCERALVTTFESPDDSFVNATFGSRDLNIHDLLLIRHDNRSKGMGRCLLGEADLSPIPVMSGRRNWHYVTCAPHTGGCLHGKVLLFRSRRGGLRVVVAGNNFYRDQWTMDRDALWVQDFPFVAAEAGRGEGGIVGPFEYRLKEFVERCSQCRTGNDSIQRRIRALFEGVDFAGARARLVYSFPGSRDERGGWKQLANTVNELVRNELGPGIYSDTDSVSGDERRGKKPRKCSDSDDCVGTTDLQPSNHAILNAISGCMGDVKPDFLLQMHRAMMGSDEPTSKHASWDDILSPAAKGNKPRIGLVRCMWPSHQLAQSMSLRSVCCGRGYSRKYWYNEIPDIAKSRVFFDAPPNPTEMGLPHSGHHARTHGKVMYMNIPQSTGRNKLSVLYVGSHNFSKAAWGLQGIQPNNVEIGVVLVTSSPSVDQQWRDRLPCSLPGEYDLSPENYVPAYASNTVKQLYQSGLVDEARRVFRNEVPEDCAFTAQGVEAKGS